MKNCLNCLSDQVNYLTQFRINPFNTIGANINFYNTLQGRNVLLNVCYWKRYKVLASLLRRKVLLNVSEFKTHKTIYTYAEKDEMIDKLLYHYVNKRYKCYKN